MNTHATLSRYISATRLRLDDLASRARGVGDADRPIVQESLIHLASTLEELRVSEEELRAQAESLASSRSEVDAELRRYRDLFVQAPDAYVLTDPSGLIREANRAAGALLGMREDHLAGTPLVVLVREEDRSEFSRRLPWIRETERLSGWNLSLTTREGRTVRVEVSVSAAREGEGAGPGLRWAFREATVFREAPVRTPEPSAPVPVPEAEPQPTLAPVAPGGPHRVADPAWCDALLLEAGRMADSSTRVAADKLAGLFRGSLALALYVGLVRPGDRIPGIREVARVTRLNHKTVARVYRALEGEGVLEVRDRSGVYVGRQGWTDRHAADGTEAWAVDVLTEAWRRRIGIAGLPELVRRWTASIPLRCACVESDPTRRAALCAQLREAFGLECVPVALDPAQEGAVGGLAEAVGAVDFVVSTPFHAGRLRALARSLRKPLVVATARLQTPPGEPSAPPELNPETARSISETMVLLNLERVGGGDLAVVEPGA